jgi:phage shock protein E
MKIHLLIFFIVITASCKSQDNKTNPAIAKNIGVQEFATMLNSHPGFLLDVRTKKEVAAGIIAGAVNINLFDEDFGNKISALDKSTPVYVYCATGGRSEEAMQILNKKGFTEVYNLDGGYVAWKAAGK